MKSVEIDYCLLYETLCKECHLDFHNKYDRKGFPNILTLNN